MSLPAWVFEGRTWVGVVALLCIAWGLYLARDLRAARVASRGTDAGTETARQPSPWPPRIGARTFDYPARYHAACREHGQAAVDRDPTLI